MLSCLLALCWRGRHCSAEQSSTRLISEGRRISSTACLLSQRAAGITIGYMTHPCRPIIEQCTLCKGRGTNFRGSLCTMCHGMGEVPIMLEADKRTTEGLSAHMGPMGSPRSRPVALLHARRPRTDQGLHNPSWVAPRGLRGRK